MRTRLAGGERSGVRGSLAARENGIALVLVLSMLVLVTGLVLALLVAVRTDSTASVAYEKNVSSRMLAETALNLVIGQVQEATQREGEAWVSQPGMIRTYDTAGQPKMGYKLYSAAQMRVDPSADSFDPQKGADLPDPAKWQASPNEFVDLNAPVITTVMDANGKPQEHRLFPIIDPHAADQVNGTPVVEGFSYDAKWTSDNSGLPSLAMPVKWLYLLKDGTVSPGVAKGASSVVTVAGSTAANPPVARLAFWTDDESCKVNLNTAGEGTFWDTPVCNTYPAALINQDIGSQQTRDPAWGSKLFESDLAYFQGAQNEFQRYPGHPATTSLSTILFGPLSRALGTSDSTTISEYILKMAPRYEGGSGSSKGGTVRVASGAVLAPGQDRLFASTDELLYSPARTQSWNDASAAESARKVIEETKFFLTATSKAPEVNLFNKPRVVAWPVHVDDTKRTAFDRLIKFCGQIGADGKNFVFMRSDPTSPTADWTAGSNPAIYAYLRGLTGTQVPGFGGALKNKYLLNGVDVKETDQILTEIFDYIRVLNLQDTSLGDPAKAYTPYNDDTRRGQVVPIDPGNGTKGIGRFSTISEVTIVMIARSLTSSDPPPYNVQSYRTTWEKTNTWMQMFIVLEPFSGMAGFSALAPNFSVVYDGININVKNAERPISFPPMPIMLKSVGLPANTNNENLSRTGGHLGPGYLTIGNAPKMPVTNWFGVPGNNSTSITAGTPADATLTIQAGSKIAFHIETADGVRVQNFEIPITRDIIVPVPVRESPDAASHWNNMSGSNVQSALHKTNDTTVSFVPAKIPGKQPSNTLNTPDIQSDYRLVQLAPEAGQFFNVLAAAEDKAYYRQPVDGKNRALHGLRNYIFKRYGGQIAGELVAGLNQYDVPQHGSSEAESWVRGPKVPVGINGVVNYKGQPGDWDNGPGTHADGAYFNKADEGVALKSAYLEQWDRQRNVLDATFFSPNRQMPSPIMLGSLPTGAKRNRPWQTLLFRPAKPYFPGGTGHPGAEFGVPEHLWLDMFWMPVVEPYSISEPFSTAGKININHQIAPFTSIRRDTGLRAVLKAEKMIAIDSTQDPISPPTERKLINRYKIGGTSSSDAQSGMPDVSVRFDVDAEKTIWQMDEFAKTKGRPFLSASEICEIPLIPKDPLFASVTSASGLESALAAFWSNKKLTGDNSLERPYAHIYPRLTTKSNTFTVHVRAQRVSVTAASGTAGEFDSKRDQVASDFRGSFVIERYLDPSSDSLVKNDGKGGVTPVTDENDPAAFLGPYKFRVVSSKQLAQ